MPSTTSSICHKLIAATDGWLMKRRHEKVVRLVERFIRAVELDIGTEIQLVAKKLLRCNQTDVNFELGVRLMMHGESAALHQERADENSVDVDPFNLAALIKLWQARSDATIATAQQASAYDAAVVYGQIRLRSLGIGLF